MSSRIKGTAVFLAILNVGTGQSPCQSPSDPWHVEATPSSLSEEVQFSNGDAHLTGTVYLPKTGNRLPAVVVLHHAGLTTRDANLYQHLCEGLPAMGIAVLVYDRRGSGQSSGHLDKADYETLADDAVAGQYTLSRFSRIDRKKIGF